MGQHHFPTKSLFVASAMGLFLCLSVCLGKPEAPDLKDLSSNEDAPRFLSKEIASQVQEQTGSQGVHLSFDPRCIALLSSLKGGSFRVEHVTIDQHRSRFTATVSTPDGMKPLMIKGGFTLSLKLPFVVRSIAPGEVIQQDDLEWNTVEVGSNLKNAVLKIEDLVEKTPRQKNLEPGKIIKARDLQKPILVKKNEMVTVIYQKNTLTIEQQGKALDEGSAGDAIRVLNPASKKPIFGTITARKQVKVGDHSPQERSVL
ncbi:MAG: flagellar basal body P-ring formation chaperone FlgA [Alphaproteobacteria bacterium]